ncbi:MAG TPA: protein-L-isoaspartate(D-aspartate) O-methyltransferase [Albitalea sp.]
MTKPPPRFPLALDRVHARRVPGPAPATGAAPTGLGLDSAGVRTRMVARLRAEGVRHEAVLCAFAQVPRHLFVDSALATQAYEDTSLPIGHGQTISKPSVVARMLELLFDGTNARAAGTLGRTLEIGTGCGYQAALLCLLARSVVSVERVRALHDKARDLIAPLRRDNLRLVYADGRLGHAPNAPYDTLVAAAGGADVPPAWLEQLAVGGRLVAPLQEPGAAGQSLVVIDRTETALKRQVHEAVHFVPLKSGVFDPR